jgi:uncharacterized membrane protein
MFQRIKFIIKQLLYDLRTGLLFRPLAIAVFYVLLEIILVTIEKNRIINLFHIKWLPWAFEGEPGAAQMVLATIAGSIITVTSIVYSMLAMSLSLSSIQFSPRILTSFMEDTTCQNVLGVFIGTFTYCLLLLRTIHGEPDLFIPEMSVSIAILMALICMGWLIYFIDHMSKFIQVNYIFEHIARETEMVIDSVFPEKGGEEKMEISTVPDNIAPLLSPRSGYIQLIDHERLAWAAKEYEIKIFCKIPVGDFTVQGTNLLYISPGKKVTEEIKHICLFAFDIGETRTFQQDACLGIRQMVDIALKAISPAINDPTTAVTCIDHLGRLLIRMAKRKITPWEIKDPSTKELLVSLKRISFKEIVDLSFTQLRQYGKTDMAVSLRLMQVIKEISMITSNKEYHKHLYSHACLIEEGTKNNFSELERTELLGTKKEIETLIK